VSFGVALLRGFGIFLAIEKDAAPEAEGEQGAKQQKCVGTLPPGEEKQEGSDD
jgi:hypothetical protein